MPRYSLSLGFFFTEVPLLERFGRAREAGFGAVEFFWPQGVNHGAIAAEVRAQGLTVELFNMFEGDYARGERGIAGDPGRVEEWRAALLDALDLAGAVGCPRVNALTGDAHSPSSRAAQLDQVVENLRWAAPVAAERGVTLLLEPLNAATHPDYLCRTTREALELIGRVGHPGVRLQYDVYQAQRGEGDIVETIAAHLDVIDHVQIADAPSRGKPGTGELSFPYILGRLDELGYRGFVGLEYRPDDDPLSWLPKEQRG